MTTSQRTDTAISLLALLAFGESQRDSVAPQAFNGTLLTLRVLL
jgi:hypothetical protein